MKQIVVSTICDFTEKIAHINLTFVEFDKVDEKDASYTVINIGGSFLAMIICFIPNKMIHRIVSEMAHYEDISEDDEYDYFKEYLNIIVGRTVSKVNNEFSRLLGTINYEIVMVCPCGKNKNRYSYDYAYRFSSDLGDISILVQLTEKEREV